MPLAVSIKALGTLAAQIDRHHASRHLHRICLQNQYSCMSLVGVEKGKLAAQIAGHHASSHIEREKEKERERERERKRDDREREREKCT